jgi:Putative Ig domain
VLAPVVVGAAVLIGAPASAAGSGTLTPFVSCVTVNAQDGYVTAYYGYRNTLSSAEVVAVGDDNQVFPADAFQGQPNVFNVGTYAQVFSVTFDPTIFPTVSWILNGQETDATAGSPACVSGVTSPPTDITAGAAVLTGVVVPSGPDATYSFEYGTTTALGSGTTPHSFLGTQPALVQAPVTGLTPDQVYYARLDTQSGSITTQGKIVAFTTPAAAPLAIATTKLAVATKGQPYTAQLTGTGGVGPYVWTVSSGSLPAGLVLNPTTGIIAGTASVKGTAHFTVTLSEPSQPTAKPVSKKLYLTVDPARSGR